MAVNVPAEAKMMVTGRETQENVPVQAKNTPAGRKTSEIVPEGGEFRPKQIRISNFLLSSRDNKNERVCLIRSKRLCATALQ